MGNPLAGGAKQVDLYRLKWDSATSQYKVYTKLTTETVALATADRATEVALTLNLVQSSKPSMQDTGLVNFDFDQYDSVDVWPFLDIVAAPSATGTTINEVVLEDGSKIGGASGSGDEAVLAIVYMQLNDQVTPNTRFVWAAIGDIAKTSGSFETSPDTFSKPSFSFVGKVLKGDVTIPTAVGANLLDEALVTPVALDIPKEKGYVRKYIQVAA